MTFDPFGNFEACDYLRNIFGEKNPHIIKRLEHHAFRLHVAEAIEALRARSSLRYDDVLDTHRRFFSDYYPRAGQDRLTILPGLAVVKAGRFNVFAHPQDIRRAVEHALGLGLDPSTMKARPGEVMGLLAYAHPLLDGNGRTLIASMPISRAGRTFISNGSISISSHLAALTHELERHSVSSSRHLA